jgi:hypothetical protein
VLAAMNWNTEKENRGSPDKKEVCRNDEDLQYPALRHCSFRWLLFKRRVAERSKNNYFHR